MTIDQLRARNLVWHYTTLDTLQFILESRTLLATEVGYQNDPREPETANEVIEETLRELSNDPTFAAFSTSASRWFKDYRSSNGFIFGSSGELVGESRFIFCASSDPDNLYAWRTYAAASRAGCAIGLDPELPLGLVGRSTESASAKFSGWREVIYEPNELTRFATEKMRAVGTRWNEENARDNAQGQRQEREGVPVHEIGSHQYAFGVLLDEFSTATTEITAVAKHASFSDERETRLTASDASHAVVFSPGTDGPRPRVRFASSDRWGEVLPSAEKRLPIKAVVLAPNVRQQAITTAQWLLHANGYPLDPEQTIDESGPEPFLYRDATNVVSIHQSEHPYRQV